MFWQDKKGERFSIALCERDDVEYIQAQLRKHDDAFAPPAQGVADERIVYKVTDENDLIIAGCVLTIDAWGVADMDILWVDKRYRRRGLGSKLLEQAEKTAREKGCYIALVGTFDFQAPDFYEKVGYTLFNIWDDFPIHHANFSFYKRLDTAAPLRTFPNLPFEVCLGEEEDEETIRQKLTDYTTSRVPFLHEYHSFDQKVVDAAGTIVAGFAAGNGSWNVAVIDMIWVDERYRLRGLGDALLSEIERQLKIDGAFMALSTAYDWQVDFFLQRGYAITGTLSDCPRGHTYYALKKRL